MKTQRDPDLYSLKVGVRNDYDICGETIKHLLIVLSNKLLTLLFVDFPDLHRSGQ